MTDERRVTRRAVLVGTLGAALAACRRGGRSDGSDHPTPSQTGADEAALNEALALEQQLLLTLTQLGAHGEVRRSETGVHADHVVALRRALGGQVTSTPAATAPTDAQGDARTTALSHRLDRQRARSGKRLQSLAETARGGDVAALLASIAACHLAPEARDGAQLDGGPS